MRRQRETESFTRAERYERREGSREPRNRGEGPDWVGTLLGGTFAPRSEITTEPRSRRFDRRESEADWQWRQEQAEQERLRVLEEQRRREEEQARREALERQRAEQERQEARRREEARLQAQREEEVRRREQEAKLQAERQARQRAEEEWQRQRAQALADQQQRETQERLRFIAMSRRYEWLTLWSYGLFGVLAPMFPPYRLWCEKNLGHRRFAMLSAAPISSMALGILTWLVWTGTSTSSEGFIWFSVAIAAVALLAAFYFPATVMMLLQYLHYLVVPHPAEAVITRLLNTRGVATAQEREAIKRALYDLDRDGLPSAWLSENRRRRIEEARRRIEQENETLEELIRNQRLKAAYWEE